MRLAAKNLVIQLKAQTRRAQTVGPNFRVFALRPLRTLRPLVFQKRGDIRLGPLEQTIVISRDLERFFPFLVARDIGVGAE